MLRLCATLVATLRDPNRRRANGIWVAEGPFPQLIWSQNKLRTRSERFSEVDCFFFFQWFEPLIIQKVPFGVIFRPNNAENFFWRHNKSVLSGRQRQIFYLDFLYLTMLLKDMSSSCRYGILESLRKFLVDLKIGCRQNLLKLRLLPFLENLSTTLVKSLLLKPYNFYLKIPIIISWFEKTLSFVTVVLNMKSLIQKRNLLQSMMFSIKWLCFWNA